MIALTKSCCCQVLQKVLGKPEKENSHSLDTENGPIKFVRSVDVNGFPEQWNAASVDRVDLR